jgi:hypothetical protein
MGIIKHLLLAVLVILGVGLGVRTAMQHIPVESLNGNLTISALQDAVPITDFRKSASDALSQKLPAIQGTVLGVQQQSASDEATLVEKTAEFALYSYCKQIVQEYEHPSP